MALAIQKEGYFMTSKPSEINLVLMDPRYSATITVTDDAGGTQEYEVRKDTDPKHPSGDSARANVLLIESPNRGFVKERELIAGAMVVVGKPWTIEGDVSLNGGTYTVIDITLS